MIKKTVELLKDKVKKHYKGCISIPALCSTNPDISLKDTPLKTYEIAPGEIMHDLKEHTVHLLLELPRHISDKDNRLEVCGIITNLRGSGTSACHYREVLISLLKYTKIIDKIGINIYNILRFLSEMSHILYSKEESRCSRQVLRYQLCAFHHTILLIELFQVKKPKMSHSLFFGQHFHCLLQHMGEALRVFNGASLYCEQNERQFKDLKTIAPNTVKHRGGRFEEQLFIRKSAQDNTKKKGSFRRQDTSIQILGKTLEKISDTFIEYKDMEDPKYQALLISISDFLKEGNGVWFDYKEEGVLFKDGDDSPKENGRSMLYHFRDQQISSIHGNLLSTWNDFPSSNRFKNPSRIDISEKENTESFIEALVDTEDFTIVSNQIENPANTDTNEVRTTKQPIIKPLANVTPKQTISKTSDCELKRDKYDVERSPVKKPLNHLKRKNLLDDKIVKESLVWPKHSLRHACCIKLPVDQR